MHPVGIIYQNITFSIPLHILQYADCTHSAAHPCHILQVMSYVIRTINFKLMRMREKNSGDTNCPSESEGNHVKYPRQGGRLGKTEQTVMLGVVLQ